MVMLDLFAGTGSSSKAMKDRGWKVFTVDIDPQFKADIIADIRYLHFINIKPDLIWASPPCDEFSRESMPWCRTGNIPSLKLVHATYELIANLQPKFWIIENTRGAQRWLGRAPVHYGPYYLWGWYPKFTCNVRSNKEHLSSTQYIQRAMIPYNLSEALAIAVEGEGVQ